MTIEELMAKYKATDPATETTDKNSAAVEENRK